MAPHAVDLTPRSHSPPGCRSYEKNSDTVASLMKEVKDMSALYETTVTEEEVSLRRLPLRRPLTECTMHEIQCCAASLLRVP